ncbi:MAG: heme-degrading domain-containing protein [Burkholderiales bacterium]|nr:heme-degrading domain-containing protein [Burkholderiales bacterium]
MPSHDSTRPQAIAALQQQEQALVFTSFDEETAYAIGQALRAAAARQQAPVAIDIRSASRRLFYTALPGATPDNEDWARRKGNVALRCHASSYLVRLRLQAEGRTPWPDAALPDGDYAVHGGAFPVRVQGTGVIAAIAVSGLPSYEGHDLVVAVLARHLGRTDLPATPLPPEQP